MLQKVRKTLIGSSAQRSGTSKATKSYFESHEAGTYERIKEPSRDSNAELITNIQYACQRHYFGAMAEAYFDNKLKDASVNVQRRQKTIETFNRLPEEFTIEDVIRCFNLGSDASARKKVTRLQRDHLIEKIGEEKGHQKALYRKTGTIML